MARFIGETLWTRIPGGSETSGEDGKLEVERIYNGAIADGIGVGGGQASWEAFVAAYPPGTPDPIYGDALRSVAYPTMTERRAYTAVATIKFSGGNFESGKDTTAPQVTKRIAAKTLEIEHITVKADFELTYFAWQTTINYTAKSEPPKTGSKVSLADATAIDLSTVLPKTPDGAQAMTEAEINTATNAPAAPKLEAMEITEKGSETGKIFEVVEVWSMVLTRA